MKELSVPARKPQMTRKLLTDEIKEFLRANYLLLSDAQLANILGYDNEAIIRKHRNNLGLVRDDITLFKEYVKETPVIIWTERDNYKTKG
jgi:hypothetical protein